MTDAHPAAQRNRRLRLWATLLTIVGLLAMVGLGSWQVDRMQWKTALIAELAARGDGPAIALPATIEPADGLEFRRARLEGRLLPTAPLFRGPTTIDRKVGYHIFLPMELTDGRQMLVALGFLPLAGGDWAAELRAGWRAILAEHPLPTENVQLEGVLRQGGWSGSSWLKPANDPDQNLWHYVDLPAMASSVGLERPIRSLYLVALSGWPEGAGLLRQRPGADLRNNHLEYAITWYALAAILLTIFLIYMRRQKATNRQDGPSVG